MKIGLYVHIPFCKSKCHYCDFLSLCHLGQMEDYVEGLIAEIENYGKTFRGLHTIASIFIGGGTPTVLPPILLQRLCEKIDESFTFEEQFEYTIEANPGTLTDEHIEVIQRSKINRVSLGLQTCKSHLLKKIGRIHDKTDWELTIQKLQEAKMTNLNTDVMFGLPDQTLEDLKETLVEVVNKGIPHVSVYSLIIEEGTRFYDQYEKGELNLPTEEVERQMYEVTKHYLDAHGYKQYEISNWAKEGYACRHNCMYWTLDDYIGVGLGAHSLRAGIRYHNTEDMTTYIEAKGDITQIVSHKECLSKRMLMEEFMFLGLRMTEGISVVTFKEKFDEDVFEIFGEQLAKWIKENLLVHDKGRLFLTEEGLQISNQVFTSFLLD